MTIAERIMLIIEKEGKSLSQFAEILNVTPAYISKIKKYPETVPSDRIINDICRIFHVNENWLRSGNGEMFQERTRETEIAEITAALFKAEDTDIRYQLHRLISLVDDEQLEAIFNAAKTWVDSVEIKED